MEHSRAGGSGAGTVDLPTGTVTFLLTDVEGSTPAWEQDPAGMTKAMALHDELIDAALRRHGGVRPRDQGEGDSIVAAFPRAGDALACALEVQLAITAETWPTAAPFRVRMALHTGEADFVSRGNYQGVAIIRAARVRALAKGGQIFLSSTTASVVRDRLPDGCDLVDLGFHTLKGLSRQERVAAAVHPGLDPVDPAELAPPPAPPANIPPPLTSFVGRAGERSSLAEALARHRLVSIVGEGGSGKTRLATEVALDSAAQQPGGVWLVDLTGAEIGEEIDLVTAEALGVKVGADETVVDAVVQHVSGQPCLVVLDNAEHVVPSTAGLVRRLLAVEGPTVMVTSQVPLGVPGEHVLRLGSLPLDESRALFLDRAGTAAPDAVAEPDDAAITELCTRLEGLPLAIELAASRARVLSVTEISARLEDAFTLLRGGFGPDRQRTLRAVLDWSHGLLADDEAVLFRRLSVFAGGFDLPGAEEVAGTHPLDPLDVIDLLTALIDRSLVRREITESRARYRLLDTVRAYAAERAEGAGELPDLRRRHLSWTASVLGRAELRGPEAGLWMSLLATDHDNIRSALAWATGVGAAPEIAAEIADGMARFWAARGHFDEGLGWCDAIFSLDPEPAVEAKVRLAAGWLQVSKATDLVAARHHLERGVELARRAVDRRTLARLLSALGVLAWNFEHSADADVPTREALEIFVELGDERGVADATYATGLVAWQGRGDLARGRELIGEALACYAASGDRASAAEARTCIGALDLQRSDYPAALEAYDSCASDAREIGDVTLESLGTVWAGVVASWGGLTGARARLVDGRKIADQLGQADLVTAVDIELARLSTEAGDTTAAEAVPRLLSSLDPERMMFLLRFVVLLAAGDIAARTDDPERAAAILTALADAARSTNIIPDELPRFAQASLDRVREELGPARFGEAAEAGVALDWQELFDLAAQRDGKR